LHFGKTTRTQLQAGKTKKNKTRIFYELMINLIKKEKMKLNLEDKIVQSVVNEILERSDVGTKKYGTNLNRNDLTELEWLQHAKEEALDMALYLEKLIQIKSNK